MYLSNEKTQYNQYGRIFRRDRLSDQDFDGAAIDYSKLGTHSISALKNEYAKRENSIESMRMNFYKGQVPFYSGYRFKLSPIVAAYAERHQYQFVSRNQVCR